VPCPLPAVTTAAIAAAAAATTAADSLLLRCPGAARALASLAARAWLCSARSCAACSRALWRMSPAPASEGFASGANAGAPRDKRTTRLSAGTGPVAGAAAADADAADAAADEAEEEDKRCVLLRGTPPVLPAVLADRAVWARLNFDAVALLLAPLQPLAVALELELELELAVTLALALALALEVAVGTAGPEAPVVKSYKRTYKTHRMWVNKVKARFWYK